MFLSDLPRSRRMKENCCEVLCKLGNATTDTLQASWIKNQQDLSHFLQPRKFSIYAQFMAQSRIFQKGHRIGLLHGSMVCHLGLCNVSLVDAKKGSGGIYLLSCFWEFCKKNKSGFCCQGHQGWCVLKSHLLSLEGCIPGIIGKDILWLYYSAHEHDMFLY